MEFLEKPPLNDLVEKIFTEEDLEHNDDDYTVADEILSYFGLVDQLKDDELAHYGIKRRSGRYPYGSGKDPFQHGSDFLARVKELKKAGFTYTDENGKTWTGDNAVAKSMGLTPTEFRRQISWAGYEERL